jgi:sec-independent protein translocase protein TatA
MRLEGWHLLIIIVLALVLFAAPKLPSMARSLGQSMRIFRSEVREMKKDGSEGSKADDARPEAVEGTVVTHPEATKKHGETNAGNDVPPPDRA